PSQLWQFELEQQKWRLVYPNNESDSMSTLHGDSYKLCSGQSQNGNWLTLITVLQFVSSVCSCPFCIAFLQILIVDFFGRNIMQWNFATIAMFLPSLLLFLQNGGAFPLNLLYVSYLSVEVDIRYEIPHF